MFMVLMVGCDGDSASSESTGSDTPMSASSGGGTSSATRRRDALVAPKPSDVADMGTEIQGPMGGAAKMKQPFGGPCLENKECEDGFCISTPQGFICSRVCGTDDDCAGTDVSLGCNRSVENFGADRQRICAPTDSALCQPCFRDEHCFGGTCLETTVGSVCTTPCLKGECPEGSECRMEDSGGRAFEVAQCVPDVALCGCSEEKRGETRACLRTAEGVEGRCVGQETCDPDVGWSGCDAPVPENEICDGRDNDCNGAIDDGLSQDEMCTNENEWGRCSGRRVCRGVEGWTCLAETATDDTCDFADNDCDGVVDEAFVDEDGLYVTQAHCGGCNRDCSARFPLATETACRVVDGRARCVIVECREGYVRIDDANCVPLASKLCEPCDGDDDCNAVVGDRCVLDTDENRFCGRDCSPNSPFGPACPPGFICGADNQCRLAVGTCLCGPDDNFILPCTLESPIDDNQECAGSRTCTAGELSDCNPPAEVCDTFDDDCDGTIDEDFTDAQGRFTRDEHCGRCNQNCPLLFSDDQLRGTGVCIDDGQNPRCAIRCDDGFVDVNGLAVDGCECAITDANLDPPDLDGIDANCDGIDGVVARGIFVSPTGNDGNQGTRQEPVRTITAALALAGAERDHVYVAAGVYEESFLLRDGVSLFGGYSADYSQRDVAGNETAIFGLAPAGNIRATMTAVGIMNRETLISGFTISGFSDGRPSANSYAIVIEDSNNVLKFANNVVRAGAGGSGLRGSSGAAGDAPGGMASAGETPSNDVELSCIFGNGTENFGGLGAQHSCENPAGGRIETHGGNGGTAECPSYNSAQQSGADGLPNANGGQGGPGGYDQGLIEDVGACLCLIPGEADATTVGVNGVDGRGGQSGLAGEGCGSTNGYLVDGEWVAGVPLVGMPSFRAAGDGRGGHGEMGQPGGGGGGGGAGSGVGYLNSFFCNSRFLETLGGGGGGGGAGGCGGLGGQGGRNGGGSFGFLVYFSQPINALPLIENNRIIRGFGGDGGDGGNGADGGDGSLGKDALQLPLNNQPGLLSCAQPGGRGGDGGKGGYGGGGGGGCGGISVGIFVSGQGNLDTGSWLERNVFPPTGTPGRGGRGGVSNGLTGGDGDDGLSLEVAQ